MQPQNDNTTTARTTAIRIRIIEHERSTADRKAYRKVQRKRAERKRRKYAGKINYSQRQQQHLQQQKKASKGAATQVPLCWQYSNAIKVNSTSSCRILRVVLSLYLHLLQIFAVHCCWYCCCCCCYCYCCLVFALRVNRVYWTLSVQVPMMHSSTSKR